MEQKEEVKKPGGPQSVDEACAEIFANHKNVGNDPSWRLKKHRFKKKQMVFETKVQLLEKFGYEMISPAMFQKKGYND